MAFKSLTPLSLILALSAPVALADTHDSEAHHHHEDYEEVEHFEGLPANTLEEAVKHFSEYNRKLEALLEDGILTAAEMGEIHELTYTLENALGRINVELDELADTLEQVHDASETADYETVKNRGRAYLSTSRKVIK